MHHNNKSAKSSIEKILENTNSPMEELPNEILFQILQSLDDESLFRDKRVNKRWMALAEEIIQKVILNPTKWQVIEEDVSRGEIRSPGQWVMLLCDKYLDSCKAGKPNLGVKEVIERLASQIASTGIHRLAQQKSEDFTLKPEHEEDEEQLGGFKENKLNKLLESLFEKIAEVNHELDRSGNDEYIIRPTLKNVTFIVPNYPDYVCNYSFDYWIIENCTFNVKFGFDYDEMKGATWVGSQFPIVFEEMKLHRTTFGPISKYSITHLSEADNTGGIRLTNPSGTYFLGNPDLPLETQQDLLDDFSKKNEEIKRLKQQLKDTERKVLNLESENAKLKTSNTKNSSMFKRKSKVTGEDFESVKREGGVKKKK